MSIEVKEVDSFSYKPLHLTTRKPRVGCSTSLNLKCISCMRENYVWCLCLWLCRDMFTFILVSYLELKHMARWWPWTNDLYETKILHSQYCVELMSPNRLLVTNLCSSNISAILCTDLLIFYHWIYRWCKGTSGLSPILKVFQKP